MKSDGLFKILATGFLLALVVYIASFSFIQHKRERHGPWRVHFITDEVGTPSIFIEHQALSITNQRISFPENHVPRPNLSRVIRFDGPITNAPPFGEIVFQDPTFLPGTVTFNFWGHEVELMPRTLIVNKEEIPWNTRTNLIVSGEGRFERKPVKKPLFL